MDIRRTAVAVVFLALVSPTLASECRWQSAEGGKIFTEPGVITVVEEGGETVCELYGNGPGNPIMTAVCGDHDWAFFTVPSTPGGDFDILIFRNTAWYAGCR